MRRVMAEILPVRQRKKLDNSNEYSNSNTQNKAQNPVPNLPNSNFDATKPNPAFEAVLVKKAYGAILYETNNETPRKAL